MEKESLGRCDLVKEGIGHPGVTVFAYDVTTSTNRHAVEYAECGLWQGEPVVFVADGQTAGRGRLGRSFISPKGSGIYLSILIRADEALASPIGVTTYAAVAATRVISRLAGVTPSIKWVNDLYLGGKKLAGILTQGVIDKESGRLTALVMGIGINVLGRIDAPEIKDIATTLESECIKAGLSTPTRLDIVAALVDEFLGGLSAVGTAALAAEYRSHSFLIGKEITVHTPTTSYPATVLDIDDECRLILRHPDGKEEALSTGEVSIRF